MDKEIQLMDVTLRDGSYAVNFQFCGDCFYGEEERE